MAKQWKLDKALVVAVMKGYGGDVPALLAAGANPNQTLTYKGITTPLLLPVLRWMPSQLDAFLAHGVFVDVQDAQGIAPLHQVVDIEVVKSLLRAGASVSVRNSAGATPLHVAMSREIAEVLVAAGADPFAISNEKLLPWQMVERLVAYAQSQNATQAQLHRIQEGADWLRAQVVGETLQGDTVQVAMTQEEQTAKAHGGRF